MTTRAPRSRLHPLAPAVLAALAALGPACAGDTQPLADGGMIPNSCTNDDGCPADQHCEAGMCVAGTGNECTADAECDAWETCTIVDDCGATRCHGNTCTPRACADS
ncbi:hypothetical protein L6R52_16755, partial [Myxococcota bacterium]|nr:hypothetical protein [Myxococcota bacterium]